MVSWTEKRVERLKLLHKEGHSGTVIARKLGPAFTKGMVAGKIHRLGLTTKPAKKGPARELKSLAARKPAPHSKAHPTKSRPVSTPPAPAPIMVARPLTRAPAPVPSAEATRGIRLYDLREGHCRWPVGEEKPAKFFCGGPALPSKSWCEHHYRMAYGHGPTTRTECPKGSSGLLRAPRESGHVEPAQRSP
jgi:GcrA cell cycle regulator